MASYKSPHDKSGYEPLTALGQPRCQAYARTHDGQCKNPAMRGARNCRMHGGKSELGAAGTLNSVKHGRYAKRFKGRLAEVYQEHIDDPAFEDVKGELAAMRTLTSAALEQLEEHPGSIKTDVVFNWLSQITASMEKVFRMRALQAFTPTDAKVLLDAVAAVLGAHLEGDALTEALDDLTARLGPLAEMTIKGL